MNSCTKSMTHSHNKLKLVVQFNVDMLSQNYHPVWDRKFHAPYVGNITHAFISCYTIFALNPLSQSILNFNNGALNGPRVSTLVQNWLLKFFCTVPFPVHLLWVTWIAQITDSTLTLYQVLEKLNVQAYHMSHNIIAVRHQSLWFCFLSYQHRVW